MKKKIEVLPDKFLKVEIDDDLLEELKKLDIDPFEEIKSAALEVVLDERIY